MPHTVRRKIMTVLLASYARNDSRVLRHLKTFHAAGLHVRLISFDPSGTMPFSWLEHMTWPGFNRAKQAGHVFANTTRGRLFYLLKFLSILYFNVLAYWKLKSMPSDVYLANDFDTLPAAIWLGRKHQTRVLYDSHELFADQYPETPRFYQQWIDLCQRRWLPTLQRVITVNASIAEELQKRHNLARVPLIILNVPEAEALDTAAPRRPHAVLYHGVLRKGRGLLELVAAIHDIPQATLILRGHGELEAALRHLVAELGLAQRVFFEDPVPSERVIAEAAPCVIGVTLLEPDCLNNRLGLPNKIFEYLHAGLAVLTNKIPEMQSLVERTGAGVCIPTINQACLRDGLLQLLQHPEQLQHCQDLAWQAAREQYHYGQEKRKWLELLAELHVVESLPSCAAS